MSSNPFRKKTPGTTGSPRTTSPKSSMRCDDRLATGDRRNKPAKRVRVLSPPPSLPDGSEWNLDGTEPPRVPSDHVSGHSHYPHPEPDPLGGASADDSDRDGAVTLSIGPLPPRPDHHVQDKVTPHNSAANPFSKSLQHVGASKEWQEDGKEEGEVPEAAVAARKTLDVDAFRSLLMTGHLGDEAASVPTQSHESRANMSSAATPPPPSAGLTPMTSHDDNHDALVAGSCESQDEEDQRASPSSQQTNMDRKLGPRPPPPSSRHGQSLRRHEATDAARDGDDAHPVTHPDPVVGSPMEVDEPHPQPEPTLRRHSSNNRKPAPAPPPRRGHSRSDSRLADVQGLRSTMASSGEAACRPESSRTGGGPVPAPPPPRRPHTGPRQPSRQSAPGVLPPNTDRASVNPDCTEAANPPSAVSPEDDKPGKSSAPAPPPPPARSSPGRRPPSLINVDASSRSREGLAPPPPPPRRNRSGSGNNAAPSKRPPALKRPPEAHLPADAGRSGKSADILADLDALQREVDALRGQMR